MRGAWVEIGDEGGQWVNLATGLDSLRPPARPTSVIGETPDPITHTTSHLVFSFLKLKGKKCLGIVLHHLDGVSVISVEHKTSLETVSYWPRGTGIASLGAKSQVSHGRQRDSTLGSWWLHSHTTKWLVFQISILLHWCCIISVPLVESSSDVWELKFQNRTIVVLNWL